MPSTSRAWPAASGTSWSAPPASTSSPGCSRGPQSKRLGQLERAGLVVHEGEHYRPTAACQDLKGVIFGLAEWGARWAFGEPRPDELDPAPFGDRRTVLHVRVPDARRSRFWFVVQPHDVSLCFTGPGHEVDVTLHGRRDLVLLLPGALRLSPVALYVRRARQVTTGP